MKPKLNIDDAVDALQCLIETAEYLREHIEHVAEDVEDQIESGELPKSSREESIRELLSVDWMIRELCRHVDDAVEFLGGR